MLEIATAKTNITPKESCYLCGHAMRTKMSTEVMDDLECTALVLKIEETYLIWESFELAILDRELSDSIRNMLSETYHIPLENITLSFVHTHSGPEITENSPFSVNSDRGVRPGYREYLIKQGMEAVKQCYENGFTRVKSFARKLSIDGYYGNRNGIDKICDKGVTIIRFEDINGKTVGGMVNLTCHPTVLGPDNLEVSGDLFGYIKRGFSKEWKVNPLMMQGAAGDMSNRCYRKGNDKKELIRIGEGILNQIFAESEEERIEIDKILVEPYHYHMEYNPDIEVWKKELDEAEDNIKTEINYDKRKLLISGIAILKSKILKSHVIVDFEAAIIRLGDVEICRIPAELFSGFGLTIKASSKAKYSILWGYTNYSIGYLVDKSQYGITFESMVSDVKIGESERITEELAAKMAGGNV